jgi:two-component system, chemotaxis family, protein-glutamate methylesterase/glutaminase
LKAVLIIDDDLRSTFALSAVLNAKGFTIVQDPESAEVNYLPQQAIDIMKPDKILNVEGIAFF